VPKKETIRKKTVKKQPNKGGRPKATINWKEVNKLLTIGCTGEEVANFLGINYQTLSRHCLDEKEMTFERYVQENNSGYKISLRRFQFRSAQGHPVVTKAKKKGEPDKVHYLLHPSVTMQIWLGKQHLGQKDKPEGEGSGYETADFEFEVISDTGKVED